jgi:tripartite-type tricarboxylate transporter receptor subunit TctC
MFAIQARTIAAWSAALALAGFCAAPARAQSIPGADHYAGKTVSYIVATAPGGNYDTYGRLIAEFMQRHLPGSTFVVRNMPGAGHLIGANALYASRPDGLTIGTFNTGLIYTQLAGHKGIKFDLKDMSWIGKASTDPRVIAVASQTSIKTFADIAGSKDTLNFATSGPGGANYVEILGLAATMKLPIKMLSGYNGTEDQLAMRRGEIVGTIASRSAFEQFVKNGYGRFVAQFGGSETDVPQMSSLVKGEEATRLVQLITVQGDIGRLTAAPPSVPAAQLATLRAAYRAALEDPDLRARAKKGDLPIEPSYGEDVAKAVATALQQPQRVVELLKEAFASDKK